MRASTLRSTSPCTTSHIARPAPWQVVLMSAANSVHSTCPRSGDLRSSVDENGQVTESAARRNSLCFRWSELYRSHSELKK